MNIISHIKDKLQGKIPHGSKRSSHWPTVRAEFLKLHSLCAVCSGKEHLEVHHIKPFHLDPSLELNPTNLITLCESKKNGINCHLAFGHLGNFKSFNVHVLEDADSWRMKMLYRPGPEYYFKSGK